MPERLTESLIRRGVLSGARASEAVERQVLCGGALDTALFELELVGENDVIEALGATYGLETASPARATSAADLRAIRAFPEQWARKHSLAPLRLDGVGRVLEVLSPAPADLGLITRLGDLLDLEIHPVLAPEFRVWQRLGLLYESEPPERMAQLIERSGDGIVSARPEASGDLRPVSPLAFGEAVNALREGKHRDDIAETTLRHAVRDLEFVALFIVHTDDVEGWMGMGPDAEKVPRLRIALKADSAFRVVLDTQAHYLGPLPSDPLHVEFLERLGRPSPRAVLIVPIRIKNRTVALLYGENGQHTIAPRLAADLMLFTTHVQGALEGLLMRKKAESITDLSSRPAAVAAAAPVAAPTAEAPLAAEVLEGEEEEIEVEEDEIELTPPPAGVVLDVIQLAKRVVETAEEATPPLAEVGPRDATEYAFVRARSDDDGATIADDGENDAEPDGWDSVDIEPPPGILEPAALPSDGEETALRTDTQVVSLPIVMGEPQARPAVVAEAADGGTLIDRLSDVVGAREPEEGWNDVQVDTWEEFGQRAREDALHEDETQPEFEHERWIESGYQELQAMRESLGEDSTVPDLSAEAWLRASSEVGRPKPLPPEILARAALPSEDTFPAVMRGVISAEEYDATRAGVIMGTPVQPPQHPLYEPLPPDGPPLHTHAVDARGTLVARDPDPVPVAHEEPKAELEVLLDQAISANREERRAAADGLRRLGIDVIPQLVAIFPGVAELDPLTTAGPLPPFPECGVLMRVAAHFGTACHADMVKKLDAPEPMTRFFATYFYSSAFVPHVIPRLLQRLHDEEPRICTLAARVLFGYRSHPDFALVLDHLHGRLDATSSTARRHAIYLVGLFRDVTAVPTLIDLFDKKEKSLFQVTEDALAEITKQRLGTSSKKWRAWWSKNQDRSRIAWLIDGLSAKDADLRKGSAEELRAVTGLDLGYDDDAPKKQREEARQRWVQWWERKSADG